MAYTSLMMEENGQKMKLNEPEKRKLDRQNSWQSAKHTKRYSDLAQAYTTGHFITVDSQQKIW